MRKEKILYIVSFIGIILFILGIAFTLYFSHALLNGGNMIVSLVVLIILFIPYAILKKKCKLYIRKYDIESKNTILIYLVPFYCLYYFKKNIIKANK
ncbi:MAG: hypothetical protein A2041_10010 [Bacteroidetes bacterium GWA2_31_9b]|nr:MAG: hypothetical protein A2041_10010 [Bacteroidetes bacterium GWA2_31_9b]